MRNERALITIGRACVTANLLKDHSHPREFPGTRGVDLHPEVRNQQVCARKIIAATAIFRHSHEDERERPQLTSAAAWNDIKEFFVAFSPSG